MFSVWATNGISRKLQPGMHFPEGKLFPSAGIGETRQASGVTARRGCGVRLTAMKMASLRTRNERPTSISLFSCCVVRRRHMTPVDKSRGYKQPVDKRAVYAACTQECVSSAFGAFGAAETKDFACYQYLGKFNSLPGHHKTKHFKCLPDIANLLHSDDLTVIAKLLRP
jgi:hypothetical protein